MQAISRDFIGDTWTLTDAEWVVSHARECVSASLQVMTLYRELHEFEQQQRELIAHDQYGLFSNLRAAFATQPVLPDPSPTTYHGCVIRNEEDANIYMEAMERVMFELAEL